VQGTHVREAFETLLGEISKRRSAEPSLTKSYGEGAHLRMQETKKETCC